MLELLTSEVVDGIDLILSAASVLSLSSKRVKLSKADIMKFNPLKAARLLHTVYQQLEQPCSEAIIWVTGEGGEDVVRRRVEVEGRQEAWQPSAER